MLRLVHTHFACRQERQAISFPRVIWMQERAFCIPDQGIRGDFSIQVQMLVLHPPCYWPLQQYSQDSQRSEREGEVSDFKVIIT